MDSKRIVSFGQYVGINPILNQLISHKRQQKASTYDLLVLISSLA